LWGLFGGLRGLAREGVPHPYFLAIIENAVLLPLSKCKNFFTKTIDIGWLKGDWAKCTKVFGRWGAEKVI
jgi:hypothetical protein